MHFCSSLPALYGTTRNSTNGYAPSYRRLLCTYCCLSSHPFLLGQLQDVPLALDIVFFEKPSVTPQDEDE